MFKQLGEEYLDTLGSIIAAEGAIVNVVGITQMNPPVKDLRKLTSCLPCISRINIRMLVPQMTPILRSCREKVQEVTINLIGYIGEQQSVISILAVYQLFAL